MFCAFTLSPFQCLDLRTLRPSGDYLKLSQVLLSSLSPSPSLLETKVFLKFQDQNLLLSRLSKSIPSQELDLFFSTFQDLQFYLNEGEEVTFIGYFEPKREEFLKSPSESIESSSEELIIPPKSRIF
jgi:hypothetical protein